MVMVTDVLMNAENEEFSSNILKLFHFPLMYIHNPAKMPLILLLVRITVCMCTNRDLFCLTVLKKCGRDKQLFFG
jgi:hypothetical protein